MKYPKVSILITHFNGEEILEKCLKSLNLTEYPNFEIIVLLNGTTDKSEKIISKLGIKFYKSETNLGFAAGNNLLISKSESKYLVVMNNDVEVERSWLKELVDFMEKSGSAAAQPKILSLRNKKKFDYAGAAGGYIDKYGFPFCRGRIFDTIENDIGQYEKPSQIFWACGSCMIIKRDTLDQVGVFDKDFFMYAEEVDLCWRINSHGGKMFYVPKSVVYHLGSFSIKSGKMENKKEYYIHRNSLIMFLKNNENIPNLIIRLSLEILSSIIFPRKIKPVIKSFLWIIKNIKKIKRKRKVIKQRTINNIVLKRSIVVLYFVQKKKTFDQIKRYFI